MFTTHIIKVEIYFGRMIIRQNNYSPLNYSAIFFTFLFYFLGDIRNRNGCQSDDQFPKNSSKLLKIWLKVSNFM